MKKIFLLNFICIAILFGSCKDMLQETPKNFLSPVSYYKTEADAKGAILSVYASRIGYDVTAAQYMIEESHNDYSICRGSYAPIGNFDQPFESVTTGRTNNIWLNYYTIINRANVVISKVPGIAMNETTKKQILAEAYYLRAEAYLNLVRYWGAVPLRLTETVDLSSVGVPRSPVADVYTQIISDLKIAETDLPDNVDNRTGRVSKWAAKILLANVYLDLENWSNAAALADEVIKSNRYSLVTVNQEADFYKIFATETCSEDIFSMHYSNISLDFQNFVKWLHYTDTPVYCPGEGWWCLYVNVASPLIINWDKNDLRRQFNIYSGFYRNGVWVNNPSATPLLFKKYIKDKNALCTYSVPVIRYTEAFLIYAEAACMAEGSPSALALERLNIIKRRGYGYDLNTPSPVDYASGMSKNSFRETVLKERAYEFMLERRRYWDLLRTKTIKKETMDAKNINYIDTRLLYPIPQNEISNNPALSQADQNPGY